MKLEETYEILKNSGQRITWQKRAILSVFACNENKMLSVNQIEQELDAEEKMDSATIYRNVQVFQELDILELLMDENGVANYILRCSSGHHHHLICKKCGKMISIECDKNKFEDITKDYGFVEDYHTLEIYGTCMQCAKEKNR